MRDLRAVAWSMSQLPGMPAGPSQGRGTCMSCGGGTYMGRTTCAKCENLQAALSRRSARADSDAVRSRRKRLHAAGDHSECRRCNGVSCWICSKPMVSHGAQRPTCGDCRRKHGAGVCSKCGGPKRLAKPGLCRVCRSGPVCDRNSWATPRACELCEEVFVPKYRPRQDRPHQHQRFCSKSCKTAWQNGARPPFERRVVTGMALKVAKSRARRLRHAESWDGITDEEILERDGWRCQIPGCKRRPIRRNVDYPHLRSKSVDHIIPLSLGGGDTAVNKRAAHLGCNLARGNRVGFEQTALFGVIREPPLVTRTVTGVSLVQPPRLCGACGEPLIAGKCRLHLPVYFGACDHCDGAFVSRDRKRRHCRDEACLKERAARTQAQARERMSEDAKERKRRRDRERRWIDPDYRARAIAATARWHDKHRVTATIG